ncbi:MAG: hypothetical protein KF900_06940 [Bacteroidetes bacterium]|nr:hypothetical protein [Bacteroidota bacterium]
MIARDLIKKDFGVDLPIKGGNGNSIDSPVIIEYVIPNDYVGVEYAYLKYLGIGRGIEWKRTKQALIEHNGRSIDKLTIEFPEWENGQKFTVTENYYFDITECFGKDLFSEEEKEFDENATINTIASASEYNLIDTFFNDQADYIKFLVQLKQAARANEEATCMAELTKEDGYYKYMLYWLKDKRG